MSDKKNDYLITHYCWHNL